MLRCCTSRAKSDLDHESITRKYRLTSAPMLILSVYRLKQLVVGFFGASK